MADDVFGTVLDLIVLGPDVSRDAARGAARQVMLRGHGCTGKTCTDPRHDGDREALDRVLMTIGLRPDPEMVPRTAWGKAAQ